MSLLKKSEEPALLPLLFSVSNRHHLMCFLMLQSERLKEPESSPLS